MYDKGIPPARSLEIFSLKKAAAIVAMAALALSACTRDAGNENATPSPQVATSVEAAPYPRQIESAIKDTKPVDYYKGNLICIGKSGDSQVVINPIILPKSGGGQSREDLVKTHDFYALVANKDDKDNTVTFRVEKIDLTDYHVGLYPAQSGGGVTQAVIKPSPNELLNSPALFDISANEKNSAYGFNIASFNYHTIGNAYFAPTGQVNETDSAPVGVLLQGQAVNHQ